MSYSYFLYNKRKFEQRVSRKATVMAWVNIFFQLLFPLSISFSPAMAATIAASAHNFSDTEPYVLGPGETVDAIAKRYGVSVEELQKINQYRTFSKPFSALTTGDEVEVPRKRSPFSVDNQQPAKAENRLESQAVAGATMLSSKNAAKSAEQMARSAANSEINNSAQQWLSQYGTARVQLNVNDDFRLDGSAVDVLVPLKDNNKNMLFTQLGARNKDSRNTLNAGIGYRTFQDNWMYGVNTFFDNDITGKNRRVGVGAEAWADYVKLSVNSYFGLTDWHQSRDVVDYYERPANGYDVRAEAYLPAYPQLGGKLMYEHYRGDDVALFGKNNRQKDPYAITAGLNYTPIPLFTVGAEHRAGKGGQSDSSLSLQFNYRLGSSWQSHIDPSAVASSRTLAGSRYDLVERNNNIVLEYQKQDVIRLTLPAQINGEAGSVRTVNAQVDSQHGLDRIEWDSSGLVAAGGAFTQVSPQSVAITLPPYQSARNSNSNVYTVTAVAYDSRGNASPRSTLQISVEPSTAGITKANLITTTNNAQANGTEINAVQAVVTDASGNKVAGQTVSFSASNGATVTTVIGTTGADGIATATLTSTTAGVSTVTATVNGNSQTVDVSFVADGTTAEITAANLTVTADDAAANGTETNAVQAVVTDASGNKVAGQTVSFSANNGAAVSTVIGTTGADGIATATLTSTTAGVSTVTATVNGKSQTVNVSFVADGTTAEITAANLTVTADDAAANGTETNAVQAVVTDASGNKVAGQMVSFSASNGATVTTVIGTTGADGIATATLTSTTAGVSVVTATVNGKSQTVATNFIALTNISANGYTFATHANFPTVGFVGATFTINTSEDASRFNWISDQPQAVSVNDAGSVRFDNKPSGRVTITATPKNGGSSLTYSFTTTYWFVNHGGVSMYHKDAAELCTNGGMIQPSTTALTSGHNIRKIGSLWGEWGDLRNYPGSNFLNSVYWTNHIQISAGREYGRYIYAADGRHAYNDSAEQDIKANIVCLQTH